MAKPPSKAIQEIEQTQEALRESIDEAKRLAEKADTPHELGPMESNAIVPR